MKILFLDQSGNLGGAELSLADVAKSYRDSCLVCLFSNGPFKDLLLLEQIPVQVLATQASQVRKDSSLVQSLGSIFLVPLIMKVAKIARDYDLVYANTQKALVIGALASLLTRRPLVYHLRDILSAEHFSQANRRIAVTLANRFASLVIANSKATQAAFVEAGGRPDLVSSVYNGFVPQLYHTPNPASRQIKQQLGLEGKFLIGHFSRLSPWKGQHVLIDALAHCPEEVAAILVGDALFGEQDYVQHLHQQVAALGFEERVQFLGFRSDVVPLMQACDLVAHTSTAPEPFGRVIVEAMLCRRPIVAAEAGGAAELVKSGKTGWLIPPGNAQKLADVIMTCYNQPEYAASIAQQAQTEASERFDLIAVNQQIAQLLHQALKAR